MPTGPAARVTDNVVHPLPPVLGPGPGSLNVLIGSLPAWRGVGGAIAGALQAAKKISDTAIQVAEAATLAAAGTPGAPAAKAAEESVKAGSAASMGSMIIELGRWRRHPFLRHALAYPAARPRRGDRRFANRADQQSPGLPHGRYRPGGGRPAEQDRQGRNDGDHRRMKKWPTQGPGR